MFPQVQFIHDASHEPLCLIKQTDKSTGDFSDDKVTWNTFRLQWDRKRNELIADGEREIGKCVSTDAADHMRLSNLPHICPPPRTKYRFHWLMK